MRTYVYNLSETEPLILDIWPKTFTRGCIISPGGPHYLAYGPSEPSHEDSGRDQATDLADALQELDAGGTELVWGTRIDSDEDVEYLRRHWNLQEELHVLEEDLIHEGLIEKEDEEPAGPVIVEFQTTLFGGERTCPRM